MVSGKLHIGGDGVIPDFEFTELNEVKWWGSRGVAVHEREPGSARVCLDCGTLSASLALAVDVKEAKKVLDKWGTDALKSRLAFGDDAV